jgi:hypothetical protein
MLKLTCMSYNLPYSFGLDATQLGGVSSRLESEQAKAEFTRGQRVLEPLAHRMKNAALIDAISKGIFPVSTTNKITRGRWSYRPHPQPDIGKESSSNINLFQSGLLNPMSYWSEDAQDPEKVADDMVRWAKIKRDKATAAGFSVEEVFGAGMAKPTSATESTSVTVPPTGDAAEVTETLNEFAAGVTPAELRAATLRELVGLLLDELPNDQAIAAAYTIYDENKTRTQLLNEVEARLKKEKEGKMSRFAAVGERGGIKGSPKAPESDTPNKDPKGEGTAKGDASGKRAEVTADQEETLQNKADEFNKKESNTKNGRATIGALKSVFQRGLGAFNTSHSPVVKSAEQWAFARVNAFLYLLKNGRPENEKYTTDFDLLPKQHPKATD